MKCPVCYAELQRTAWMPTEGYDSRMREFKCPNHHLNLFIITRQKTIDVPDLPVDEAESPE